MISKKWLALTLAMLMMFGLIGTVGFAKDNYPAAPAIAGELLRDAGVKQLGPFVSAVARETRGRNAEFQGIAKDEPGYREAVRDFLVDMPGGVPFSPSYVRDMVLWLDASVLELGDGDEVDIWHDESGKRFNASQDDTNRTPVYIKDSIGGLPAVKFDGNNDMLELPNAMNEVLNAKDGISIFLVMQGDNEGAFETYFTSINESGRVSDTIILRHCSTMPDFRVRVGGTDYDLNFVSDPRDGNPHVITALYDVPGIIQSLFIDGILDSDEDTGTTQSDLPDDHTIAIGNDPRTSGRAFGGEIAEIIIYSHTLTETQQSNVEQYLMDKYGL